MSESMLYECVGETEEQALCQEGGSPRLTAERSLSSATTKTTGVQWQVGVGLRLQCMTSDLVRRRAIRNFERAARLLSGE